jgi:hypothetical protein
VSRAAARGSEERLDDAVHVFAGHHRLVPLDVDVDVGADRARRFRESVGPARRLRRRRQRLAAGPADRVRDSFVVRRDEHPVETAGRPGSLEDVHHHRFSREKSQRLSGESDGGVTGGDDPDNDHVGNQSVSCGPAWVKKAGACSDCSAPSRSSCSPARRRWPRFAALRDRRELSTGSARWIWYTREIPEPARLRFRAWKEFPIEGPPPASARLLFFADREWSLEVNGAAVSRGSQKPGDALARFDVARFLRSGTNRLSVEVESSNGVGGLLLELELPGGRALVTDGSWRVERLWPASEGERAAVVWGRAADVSVEVSRTED